MSLSRRARLYCLFATGLCAAHAQTLTTIVSFNGNNGAYPSAAPIQAVDGNLYGTTGDGGLLNPAYGTGSVYKIDGTGSLTTLYSFQAAESPYGGLVQGSDGMLYGTTAGAAALTGSGTGTVFAIAPTSVGKINTLHTFANTDGGTRSYSTLIQAADGNLYGTTYSGSIVFKVSTAGAFSTLHTIDPSSEGCQALGGLMQASDGNLYGTTTSCPTNQNGTVFRITPGGAFTTLHSFSGGDGVIPYGVLLQAKDGNLYGTTIGGGTNGIGVIFRVTLSGAFTLVYSFRVADGAGPNAGVIQLADGSLYGTTYGGGAHNLGTVFKLAPDGTLTVLHNFAGPDGSNPKAGLLPAKDGNLYGATTLGGANSRGTIFRLDLTPTQQPPPTLTPNGIVPIYSMSSVIQQGEWVSIYGTNLSAGTTQWKGDFPTTLGNTTVSIDGKAAYLSLVSPGQINLQVPTDSTTGNVTVAVTTPGGTATATVNMSAAAPSFLLLDSKHLAGIILRNDGSGAYGSGSYDIMGPRGTTLGYATVPAAEGDVVELFATGLGPTTPLVPAGQAYSGAASTTIPVVLQINGSTIAQSFAGLSGAGLYQINLVMPPGLGIGDVPIAVTVGTARSQAGVVVPLGPPR